MAVDTFTIPHYFLLGITCLLTLSEPSPSKSLRAEWKFGLSFCEKSQQFQLIAILAQFFSAESNALSEPNVVRVEHLCDSRSVGMYRVGLSATLFFLLVFVRDLLGERRRPWSEGAKSDDDVTTREIG